MKKERACRTAPKRRIRVDNDTAPTLTASLSPTTVNEGDGAVTFTLTVDGSTSKTSSPTFELNTVDGTATAGEDCDAISLTNLSGVIFGTLPEPIGACSVTILDDQVSEGPETFSIRLTSRNSTVEAADFVITINDDDPPP